LPTFSQPILRIAGARVNRRTNGPQRTAGIYAITLKKDCGRQRNQRRGPGAK